MSNNRTIFHIDVNSAFLSWTAIDMLRKGAHFDPRTVPSIIGGDESKRGGIVLAKSFPAKKYNILTGESIFSARCKCPQLIALPPTYGIYNEESRKLIELLKNYSPDIEQYSVDECFLDYTNMEGFFGDALTAAKTISNRIKAELGFTVNIGISCNKALAKMAGELSKPDKIHTLYPDEIKTKMWPLPIGELFMVGRQTAKKMSRIGIKTIGDLAQSDIKLLEFKMHSHARLVWNYANGIDDSPINTISHDPKSISISRTTAADLTTREEIAMLLLSLCETLGNRVRTNGYIAGGIHLYLRNIKMEGYGSQKKFDTQTNCTSVFYDAAISLLDLLWDGKPVRKAGIGVWAIQKDVNYQYNIWYGGKYERWGKVDTAIDKIRDKYGKDSIMRCSFLDKGVHHMSGSDGRVVAFAPRAIE